MLKTGLRPCKYRRSGKDNCVKNRCITGRKTPGFYTCLKSADQFSPQDQHPVHMRMLINPVRLKCFSQLGFSFFLIVLIRRLVESLD